MKKSTFIKLILVSSLSSCAMEHEPGWQSSAQQQVPDTLHHDTIPGSYTVVHEVYHVHYINRYSYYGGYRPYRFYHHSHAGKPAQAYHTTSHSTPRTSRSGFGTLSVSVVG